MGEVVRSWWEKRGEEEMVPRDFPPFSPLPPTNLELTRAGREVAESSQAPPRPPRGSPRLWVGLPLLLPWPLDRPHLYLVGARGPPSRWVVAGGRLPGQGTPRQMGLHGAGQLGRGLAGHAASLHRMRSARGAWSPWSFTAWMRRYAAVVKPIGGVDGDGGVGVSQAETPETGLFS